MHIFRFARYQQEQKHSVSEEIENKDGTRLKFRSFFFKIRMERSVKEIPPISADIEMFLPYSITNRTTQVLPSNGPTFVKVYR